MTEEFSDMHRMWCITDVFVEKSWKKIHITTSEGMHLTCQIHPMSCVMPHPPPHIWEHPHDQSQAPTLLNQFLTIRHIKSISM